MRYLIRERIFSIGDSFTIQDEMGMPRYEVRSKVFTIGNKLTIYDMNGKTLAYIEQKIFKLLPEYYIYLDGRMVARVKREFTLFKPRFNIDSELGSFRVEGDVLAHDFCILKNNWEVARIAKKWISFSDTYSVDISDSENQPFMLALVIVLDQVLYDNRGGHSNN